MEAARKPKDMSKAREKERKREEKELKRLAAASGVKLAAAPMPLVPPVTSAPPSSDVIPAEATSSVGGWATFKKNQSSGFKSSGWAAVSGSPAVTTESDGATGAPKTGGWTRVARSSTIQSVPATTRGTASVIDKSIVSGISEPRGNPIFQSSGFTQLDTTDGIAPAFAPPPPSYEQPPPPPEPSGSECPIAGTHPSRPSSFKLSNQQTRVLLNVIERGAH